MTLPLERVRTARTSFAVLVDRHERRIRALTQAVVVGLLCAAILIVVLAVADGAHAEAMDALPAGRVGIAAVLAGAFFAMAMTSLHLIRRTVRVPRRRPPLRRD